MESTSHQILIGDNRATMATMPAQSVHCVVTSPPYWGLRDYGIPPVLWADGTESVLGLEATPELFVAHMVEVFQAVRRVLRDDGVIFVNLGDSYATGGGKCKNPGGDDRVGTEGYMPRDQTPANRLPQAGLKPGDLCNIPHRVAEALQADGWFWRSTIVWAKRSPMPESLAGWRWVQCRVKVADLEYRRSDAVNAIPSGWNTTHQNSDLAGRHADQKRTVFEPCPGCDKCRANDGLVLRRGKWRPTTAHEYIFMFSKSARYFCDGDAVKELCTGNAHSRGDGVNPKTAGAVVGREKQNGSFSGQVNQIAETRNPRSVWTLSSEPYKEAHFATYPTEIPRRCINAGTSSAGCCPACGSCYAPVIETERVATRLGIDNKIWKHEGADAFTQRSAQSPNLDPQRHIAVTDIIGYRATCSCNAGEPQPCTVFDPFLGSGTTVQVAKALGRNGIGCEINEAYAELAENRINTLPKWARPQRTSKPKPVDAKQQSFLEVG